MWLKETKFRVRLGGNTYINTPVLIEYQKEPLFALNRDESGHLAIDFDVYTVDRKRIARVKRNNIYPNKDYQSNYELQGSEDTLSLVDRDTGKTVAEIKKRQAAAEELDVSVSTYLPNGTRLILGPGSSNIAGNTFTDCTFSDCRAAISIE